MKRLFLKYSLTFGLLFVLLLQPVSASSAMNYNDGVENPHPDTKKMISARGIEFTVQYTPDGTVEIDLRNPSERVVASMYAVSIDDYYIAKPEYKLEPGEDKSRTLDFTQELDATRYQHQLSVSTAGAVVHFNFTREVDISDNGSVPIPYIQNVTVGNGHIKGEPSTVANVTITNPAPRIYGLKLMASTEGTNGSHYVPVIYPGKTKTITVELLEKRGTNVAGEVRIYAGKLATRRGAIDQVEFVGRTGEGTRFWNTSYRPVKPPWDPDNYVYENESVDTASDRDFSGVIDRVREYQREVLGVVGVFVVLLLGRRLRG